MNQHTDIEPITTRDARAQYLGLSPAQRAVYLTARKAGETHEVSIDRAEFVAPMPSPNIEQQILALAYDAHLSKAGTRSFDSWAFLNEYRAHEIDTPDGPIYLDTLPLGFVLDSLTRLPLMLRQDEQILDKWFPTMGMFSLEGDRAVAKMVDDLVVECEHMTAMGAATFALILKRRIHEVSLLHAEVTDTAVREAIWARIEDALGKVTTDDIYEQWGRI